MKSFWKKFFEPMRGEMKPVHIIVIIIASVGIFIPTLLYQRCGDMGFWMGALLFLSWHTAVWFVYLLICYFKTAKNDKI